MPPAAKFRRTPQLTTTQHDAAAMYRLLYGALPGGLRLPVTDRTVLGLAGAWAAVSRIANNVALMLTEATVEGADERPTVVADPCTEFDPFTFWKTAVATALCRGNSIGIPYDHDDAGFPTQVLLLPPDAVHAYYDTAGYRVYRVGDELLSADEVVHVRCGVTIPGEALTVGVVEAHRRELDGMLSQQGMAASVYREANVPSGIVQLDTPNPTADQATTVKTNWSAIHEGRRTVAVIGNKMSYTPVSWSSRDAEFLESRQFSIAESALMFGLRPEDLGASLAGSSGAITYGNRSDDALQRITDAYTPIMLPIELTWSRLTPDGVRMRGAPEALLRSTTRERLELRELAQRIGVETRAESRAEERPGSSPITDPAPAGDPNGE